MRRGERAFKCHGPIACSVIDERDRQAGSKPHHGGNVSRRQERRLLRRKRKSRPPFFSYFWASFWTSILPFSPSFLDPIESPFLHQDFVMAAPAYTPVPTNPFSGSFPLPPSDESPATLGLGFIKKFREERLSSLRPMSEFFDTNRFSKPTGLASVTSRFNYNLSYFQGNYMLLFLGITAYSLITNVMLMFSVGVVVGGMHFISKVPPEGTVIGSTTYSARQLQTGLMIVAVPLFFFSSTIGTIFYIIGASAVTILGHAAFMQEGVEGDFANTV